MESASVTHALLPADPGPDYRRSRKLFVSTDTDENDMAAAAIMGLSCQPVQG
jgi:hypothetical protein